MPVTNFVTGVIFDCNNFSKKKGEKHEKKATEYL